MPEHESRLSRPQRAAGRVVEVLSSRPVAFVLVAILALAAFATTTRCSEPEEAEADPEVLESLRALGYIE